MNYIEKGQCINEELIVTLLNFFINQYILLIKISAKGNISEYVQNFASFNTKIQ